VLQVPPVSCHGVEVKKAAAEPSTAVRAWKAWKGSALLQCNAARRYRPRQATANLGPVSTCRQCVCVVVRWEVVVARLASQMCGGVGGGGVQQAEKCQKISQKKSAKCRAVRKAARRTTVQLLPVAFRQFPNCLAGEWQA